MNELENRTIRLSQTAKEQLSRLKTKTGIKNWNVLSRWALCISLADPSAPSQVSVPSDSSVEMTWKVFSGEAFTTYAALVRERCVIDGLSTESEVIADQLRIHLHRGIGQLAGTANGLTAARLLGISK